MPLRLAGIPTAPSAPPVLDPALLVAQLVARAPALLLDGRLDAYRELFTEANALEDPQRAYQATVLLLEQGMRITADTSDRLAARIYGTLADLALTALELAPAEPILLNLAGIACYELWSLEAARALFTATRRLDPSHPDVERNLSELARRRRGPRPRRPLHPVVMELARRAQAVARRAQPAEGMTVSLCMIVKDEEERLGECLAAAAPGVDEIIVVDTGSSDSTIEIARAYGATVIQTEWTGDFSVARNVSLDAATRDWILWLDADEVLVAEDLPRLRALCGRSWQEAVYLVETSYVGELGDATAYNHQALRLLRNRPSYRFRDRIHEQVYHSLPDFAPGRIGTSSVRLEHYGYLGKVREAKQKSTRNAELLRRQIAEGREDPFLHHNLGSEYGAIGDQEAAVEEFEQAWSMLVRANLVRRIDFGAATLLGLVKTLRATGRFDEFEERVQEGLGHFPDLTDLVYERAVTAMALGNREQARADYEAAIAMGPAPARYGGMTGTGSWWPRAGLASMALQDGDARTAREHLAWCLEHTPSFQGAAGGYVTARLREGAAPEQALAELRRQMTLGSRAHLSVGLALQRAGAGEAAIGELTALLQETHASELRAAAQLALAELRLGTGAFATAARHAAAVPVGDLRAALARRIELCARIAAGELVEARHALGHAASSGVPTAERAALAAWLDLAEGERPVLPIAGVPLIATFWEILIPVSAAAAGQLRSLIAGSALPERDRRQLLAETALRHGDLAAAAVEWMAVARTAPDSSALAGLAQVALAHGTPKDAGNFARGALALDPACAPARAVLELVAEPASEPKPGLLRTTEPAREYALDA